MSPIQNQPEVARSQVILLGASNLTIGWRDLLVALNTVVQTPMDLRVALGMGRSYVDWSRFWFRRLPGIIQSGLWSSLPARESGRPLAMLTDIGNDIVYERKPDEIFQVIEECVSRLRCWNPETRLVMTGLPLQSVASVGPVHFRIARTILFPGCRLSLRTILSNSERLDSLCRQFAQAEGIAFVDPQRDWYGVDPIHVLPMHRVAAFEKFFSAWSVTPTTFQAKADQNSASAGCSLPCSHERTLFGIRRLVNQPAVNQPSLTVSAF
jgi:hypothetical protein